MLIKIKHTLIFLQINYPITIKHINNTQIKTTSQQQYQHKQMSDDQDIGQLKAKLQAQAIEFQSYKQQCKHLQQILEEECQKKQSEIKQLKQQAIKKEKGEKMLKAQVSQLEAEVANLKMQVSDAPKVDEAAGRKEEMEKMGKQYELVKDTNKALEGKLQESIAKKAAMQAELNEANAKVEALKKALLQAEQKAKSFVPPVMSSPGKDSSKTQEQLKKTKDKLVQMQKDKSKAQKQLKDKQIELQKLKHQTQQKLKKLSSKPLEQKPLKRQQSQPKQLKDSIPLSQHKHQLSKLNQTIHQLQQRVKQLEVNDKEQKVKLTQVMNEKTALLQKYKKLGLGLERERERREELGESPSKSQEIVIEDGLNNQQQQKDVLTVKMDSLLLTKKHYISPFIQIKDGKLIKLYKSTKNGFQKSLGATRHKFDSVSYDPQSIVQTASDLAKTTLQQGKSHSIVVYGSKRTSKKQIFSGILEKMKDWFMEKVDQYQQSQQEEQGLRVQVVWVKHSADAEVHEEKEVTGREEIAGLLEELCSGSGGGSSSPTKKTKKNQKPKVRYLLFSFGQSLRFQLITTSHLNPFLKQNQTFTDYLNTIIFGKLQNILQSINHHYHIITLVNPIVSEYEECKNTLSITMVPLGEIAGTQEPMTSTLAYSPIINREDLNDLTKKKLESFEKETEQAGIRMRRYEEECAYYKGRFEELQVRLKNLINTHQQQNTYLKKSPVTLSYEKLLKFVNSVLSRNTSLPRQGLTHNLGQTSEDHYQNQVNMYIEEDAKSLDGY